MQVVRQHLAPAQALGDEQDPASGFADETPQGLGRLGGARLDAERRRRPAGEVAGVRIPLAPALELRPLIENPGQTINPVGQFVRPEIELRGGQQGPLQVVAALLVAALDSSDEGGGRIPASRRLQGQDPVGQVVEEGGGLLEKERKVILEAPRGAALGHLPVDQARLGIARKRRPIPLAEGGDRLFAQGELPGGEHAHPFHSLPGPLGVGVEATDALHLLVKQVDAQGHLAAHRKDVEQGAAHRELAVAHDLGDAGVTGALQPAAGRVQVQPVSHREHQRVAVHVVPRRQPLHQGGHGHHQDPSVQARYPMQREQSLRDQLREWREDVVGQGLPVGETEHGDRLARRIRSRVSRQEELKLGAQGAGCLHVLHQRQHQPRVPPRGLGDGQCRRGPVQPAPEQALPGLGGQGRFQRGVQHGGCRLKGVHGARRGRLQQGRDCRIGPAAWLEVRRPGIA